MLTVPFDIDQQGWGSDLVYADDPDFAPRYIVVHWGGSTAQIVAEDAPARLRIWQRYHRRINPATGRPRMRDIAYNYGVDDDGTIYRLRGLNPGGHVKCRRDWTPEGDSYCDASIGVVWIGGANDPDGPSDAAYAAMGRIVADTGLEVKGHRTVKKENGSSTTCPGNDWLTWITEQGWNDTMFTHFTEGSEHAEWELIVWTIMQRSGGTINTNTPALDQTKAVLPYKTSMKLVETGDLDAIADILGLSDRNRQRLHDNGLYRWGKEIAKLVGDAHQ